MVIFMIYYYNTMFSIANQHVFAIFSAIHYWYMITTPMQKHIFILHENVLFYTHYKLRFTSYKIAAFK